MSICIFDMITNKCKGIVTVKVKKIAVIGHFGGKESFYDGQTIKTKILHDELAAATDWKIIKVDTYYKRKNPLKLLCQTVWALFTARDIVVLLSKQGRRLYFPLLYFFARAFGTRVYHSLIGSKLDSDVAEYPVFKKYLNGFVVNWVETSLLRTNLENHGVTNARVMPNFKRLNVIDGAQLPESFEPPYRFCTFSRVMKEKGIEDAVFTVEKINQEAGKTVCALDIYGKVDEGYETRFAELMAGVSDAVTYRGIVPFDKSVEAIKEYYALLFPTYWRGEGFAGTIVDAFSAGLPVIATDWNCNGEIVENGVTGLLYPSAQYQSLEEAVCWVIENPAAVGRMKKQCVQAALGYQPEKFMDEIVKTIETGRTE